MYVPADGSYGNKKAAAVSSTAVESFTAQNCGLNIKVYGTTLYLCATTVKHSGFPYYCYILLTIAMLEIVLLRSS